MTNTKLILAIVLTACTSGKPAPESIWDFADRDLSAPPTTLATATSPKAQVRRAFDQLQPALLRCTAGTAGILDVTLRIGVDTEQPAVLEDVTLTYPDHAALDCARDAFAQIDLSHMPAHEPATWVVHMPLVVR